MGKVKWDSTLDQILLIKVLETCDINPSGKDFQSMSESWPAHLEKPTPRAISEHLFLIRKKAKKAINPDGGNASASVSPEKADTKKKPTTKAKPAAKAKGGKRKRNDDDEDSASDDGVKLAVKIEDDASSTDSNGNPWHSAPKAMNKKARNARSGGVPIGEPVFEGKVETEAF